MPETHITIPLDLPEVRVLEVEVTGAGYRITVESTLKGIRCRRCGRTIEVAHGYNDWVEVQHLPIFDRAVFIRYRPKRYRCPYCERGPTTTQEVSWHRPQSGFTKAFEEHLLKALINSPVQDVSLKDKVSYDAVSGVLERRIAGQVDWSRFTCLSVLGIDEIALKKGQRDYAVIISARLEDERLAVLGVLGDRFSRLFLAIALLYVWVLSVARRLCFTKEAKRLTARPLSQRYSLFQFARRWLAKQLTLGKSLIPDDRFCPWQLI